MDVPIPDSVVDTPVVLETPDRIDGTAALESMSTPERAKWNESGALPERITVAGDAPADPDAEPEPEPAVIAKAAEPKPLSKRQQEINEHIRRATAAELKVKDLEAQIAKEQRPEPKAEPKVDAKADPPADADREPTLDDFLDQPDPYLSLQRALTRYDVAQTLKARDAEHETRTAAARDESDVQRLFTEYQTREAAFKATRPEFDAHTQAVRNAINVSTPLGRALVESPIAPELILHFADHPDDFTRIGSFPLPTALRELGKLEARLEAGATPSVVGDAPKHVTSAPRPPTTLGSRTAEAADAVESAVTRKDVGAYIREVNARELAAARR
jgi:hypothetical protein